jgi:outer membrane lipoprotein-sorting protein
MSSTYEAFAQETALEIVTKSDEKLRGKSSKGTMRMIIKRPSWEREIVTRTWSLGTEYAMIYIDEPKRDHGTVFLKRDKEIWNWQPSIERTIKLPPSMMMQSWMGSDFTNDDLVRESSIIKDYTHTRIKDTLIDGINCAKLLLDPKPEAAVVWGKIFTYISLDGEYLQLRVEFYDEDGYLVNIMEGKDVGEIGGKILPRKMIMSPVDEPGNSTIMINEELEFDIDVDPSFFSVQNMKKIR